MATTPTRSSTLIRNWNDSSASILPIYRELIGTGLRIWVFR
jgi:serine carboxypeptidase-like clade 2